MGQLCYGCMNIKNNRSRCEHCGYPETGRNELHQLPLGTVLQNNYVIGKVLGQGGFGITYLGWDRNLEEPVAIKEYFPSGQVTRTSGVTHMVHCTSGSTAQFQEGRDRFLREARTLAKLRKVGNIVQIMNFFSENNTAYIVMEYVKGITLQEYIRRRGGRLTVAETFTILRPIIRALDQVHQAGMIHRDISPDNIMLQYDNSVKLLDFGTARDVAVTGDGQMTHSTQAVLKHGFAPMEQYSSGRAVDLRADEYALCATVYYCLTGQIPPDAPQQVMDGVRPNWRAIPGLTTAQYLALERGSAVRAEDRFSSLRELDQVLFGPGPAPATQFPQQKPVPTGNLPYGYATAGNQKGSGKKSSFDRKWLIPGIAGLVAVAALVASLALLSSRDKEAQISVQTPISAYTPAQTEAPSHKEAAAPDAWMHNVLMADTTGSYPGPETVFGSNYDRTTIASVTFLDTLANAPADAWDVSEARDGRVMAWANRDGGKFHLYIAGEGGVRAPSSCQYLFSHYENMTSLDFGGNFHFTSDVTNMDNMFSYCQSLESLDLRNFDTSGVTDMTRAFLFCQVVTELDLSSFDTSNVTEMNSMFMGCYKMIKVNVSSFDTSNVTNMDSMFSSCQDLKSLDLRNFNTSRVTNMSSMFSTCNDLQTLDVSSFDTSRVTDMSHMFPVCVSLRKLDLSNFDTSNVTNMKWMFYAFADDCDLNLGNWETGSVTDYDTFMDEGVTYNGKPWKKLFD